MQHGLWMFAILAVGFGTALGGDEARPFGIDKRVPLTTSRVIGSPEPPPGYRIDRILPDVNFRSPVHVIPEVDSDRLLVIEVDGSIKAVRDTVECKSSEVFLDLGKEAKRQFYGMTFHPKYLENRFVYLFSNSSGSSRPRDRVSRFMVSEDQPRHALPETETTIIEWDSNGHNGGDLAFANDGTLFITAGDGTSGGDPAETGQDLIDLLATMIHIDVDHPSPGMAYAIPKNNPFLGVPGARPEIWAFGFRNPWRISIDRPSGQIWVGDIGQDLWEMVLLVERAGNYGWSVQEGSHPFHPYLPPGITPILKPVIEHHHVECRSIVGGAVYHGAAHSELQGAYLYGDHEYGKIWAIWYDAATGTVTKRIEVADTAIKMLGFGISPGGEIYVTDYVSGELYRLVPTKAQPPRPPFPRTLSETGLFVSVKDHTMAPGVIPYSVNAPFWSDGAAKERFIAVPHDKQVEFLASLEEGLGGAWVFDDESVIVKSFRLPTDTADASKTRWIETRLLVKQENHWQGYSYLWNHDQTDATLVEANGADKSYTIRDPKATGGERSQVWHYPSRAECMVCHSRAAGFVLGLDTVQMNRDQDYVGVVDNQIRTLEHIGMFKNKVAKTALDQPGLVNPYDKTADLEARARSYLHVNCAICHVYDGGGNSWMKMRFDTAPEEMKILDVKPMHESFGLADPKIVAPGSPDRSVLLHRTSQRGGKGQMPPLSTTVVDQEANDLLREWIAKMKP